MNELAAPPALLVLASWCGWIVGRRRRALEPPSNGVGRRARTHDQAGNEAVRVQPEVVKVALHDLFLVDAPRRHSMQHLVALSPHTKSPAELRALLADIVGDAAISIHPRDAEAGRLLLLYYVKRAGSHEVVMERLHLSRPTFYRRLNRGLIIVAERLDSLSATPNATMKHNRRGHRLGVMRGETSFAPAWGLGAVSQNRAANPTRESEFKFLSEAAL